MRLVIFFSLLSISIFAKPKSGIVDIVDNIALNSQKIANNYLMIYHKKNLIRSKEKVMELILSLEENYRSLAKSVKSEEDRQMLEYLSYSKDKIKEIIAKKTSKDNADEMQDISKTLLEGCRSFAHKDESLSSAVKLEMLNNCYISKGLKLGCDLQIENIENNLSKEFETKISWRSYKELYEKKDLFVPYLLISLSDELEADR